MKKKKKKSTKSKASDVPKDLGGRPTVYRKVYAKMAYKLCLLDDGTTDKDLASFFDVSVRTINNWKQEHPKFLQSISEGKKLADMEVAQKLFERAMGYSHPDVHISNYQGDITITKITKHYPPDFNSMRLWLTFRAKWVDKQEHEHKGQFIFDPPRIG